MTIPSDCGAGDKALQWLISQNIIANPDDRFTLTLAGQKSVQQSIASHRAVAEFFEKGEVVFDRHEPAILMLAIMKIHFVQLHR